MRGFLILIIVAVLGFGAYQLIKSEPTFDATTVETLEISSMKVTKGLSLPDVVIMERGIKQLMMNSLIESFNQAFAEAAAKNGGKLPENPDKLPDAEPIYEKADTLFMSRIHGKTGNDLILYINEPETEKNQYLLEIERRGLIDLTLQSLSGF